MERPRVGIVVPALNEAATIVSVVERIKSYGRVIVVDDGSTDDTAELARNAGAEVVSHTINQGYDGALNTGFALAVELGCAYIITMDADGQHNPDQLARMIVLLEEGYELVLGIRNRFARISETIFSRCANYFWGVIDPMCGMKGYATTLYTRAGCFDRYKLIGSELAVRSIVGGCRTAKIKITVSNRIDAPRFGTILTSNYRILRAMFILMFMYPPPQGITFMNTKKLNVAIIGCGQIGTQWDAKDTSTAFSLTHAAGFFKHPRAQLVAMCDKNLEKARQAALRWDANASYCDPRKLFAENQIDVAVVATSSAARWNVIEPALASGVKVLVIEKPLAMTIDESRKLVAAIDAAGVVSIVNFSRNWDPSMRILSERIRRGDMGLVQRIVGTYGKGLANNGSHMINLCALLCEAKPVRARSLASPLNASEAGWNESKDRAWDAQIDFESKDGRTIQLTMLGTDQNAFTCFELRIIGSTAVCEIINGGRGIVYKEIQNDPQYEGYRIPGDAVSHPARALEAMDQMVDESLRLAAGEIKASSCDVHNAMRTALTVDAINHSAHNGGHWQKLIYLENK